MRTITVLLLLGIVALQAQIKTPQPSPFSRVEQTVGITDVKIEYSRPGIKGRQIFGTLVPFGKVWRTGANNATRISFSTDVTLEGKKVPAGTYSLYTVPNQRTWKIIINKKLDSRQYHDAEYDLVTFKVKPQRIPLVTERFTIEITDMTDNAAHIQLAWAQTRVSIRLSVETDKLVMEQIEAFVDSDEKKSAADYFLMAQYYFKNNKDLDDAEEFIDASIELESGPFWVLRLKAEIAAKKGDFETAVLFAKRSLVSAQKAGNQNYIDLNKKSIEEWNAAQ